MNQINTMTIMYVIVVFLGVYLLVLALKMNKSKKVDSFIVPAEVLARCKDEKAMALDLAKAMKPCAIVFIIGGVILAGDDYLYDLGYWMYAVAAVVSLAFVYFYKILTDVKIKYF